MGIAALHRRLSRHQRIQVDFQLSVAVGTKGVARARSGKGQSVALLPIVGNAILSRIDRRFAERISRPTADLLLVRDDFPGTVASVGHCTLVNTVPPGQRCTGPLEHQVERSLSRLRLHRRRGERYGTFQPPVCLDTLPIGLRAKPR